MLSFFAKAGVKTLQAYSKTAAIDVMRVTAGAGLVWTGYSLFDKVHSIGLFAPQPGSQNGSDVDSVKSYNRHI